MNEKEEKKDRTTGQKISDIVQRCAAVARDELLAEKYGSIFNQPPTECVAITLPELDKFVNDLRQRLSEELAEKFSEK